MSNALVQDLLKELENVSNASSSGGSLPNIKAIKLTGDGWESQSGGGSTASTSSTTHDEYSDLVMEGGRRRDLQHVRHL